MSGTPTEPLTIVSVVFGDPVFLHENIALVAELNPGADYSWVVADNNVFGGNAPPSLENARVIPGVAPPRLRDHRSLHHALALEKALGIVRTRYVLMIDPDFYVIRRGWIDAMLKHMTANALAIFGSVWHPRWFYQYRDFPTVHFMLIDLEQVPVAAINLKPAIDGDRWWRFINRSRALPNPLRDTLKVGRCRDTGWQLHRRFRDDPAIRIETLVPHYVPPDSARRRWEERLALVLPKARRVYPADPRAYCEASFLRRSSPEAYRRGWEEFFWRDEPFAVHLRRVGRKMMEDPIDADEELLRRFLASALKDAVLSA